MIQKRKGKNRIYYLLMILIVIVFWIIENYWNVVETTTSDQFIIEHFEVSLLPISSAYSTVFHDYFVLGYSEQHEQAAWVAWELLPTHLSHANRKRPYFEIDFKVPTGAAHWKNYKKSGFDRGHLCPAGDRRFSLEAYNQTFLTSNIAPQRSDFNAGVWNRLEIQTRAWCKYYGPLWIMTAGVLENGLDEIGEEGVDVPKQFYKIIYRKSAMGKGIAIAFLIPHEESSANLKSFVVTIDELEKKTGINFFEALADDFENEMESKTNLADWKF